MEPTEIEALQSEPTITLNGKNYAAGEATPETIGLVQDLSTIQAELNRLKVSFDIAGIARQAILNKVEASIDAGESGLVLIEDEPEASETTETTQA